MAGYCLKKQTTREALDTGSAHLVEVGDRQVVEYKRKPEFITMSRNPGLGQKWIEKYWRDVYPHDRVRMDGKEFTPPEYYDRWLKENQPEVWETVQRQRRDHTAQKPMTTPLQQYARGYNFQTQEALKPRDKVQ